MDKIENVDITEDNIQKIKELFPNTLTDEGKIDFDILKSMLSVDIDDRPEKYQFTWNGKRKTIQFAQSPSVGTLRPVKEESKDWGTTENLYIEGDNLEVLKLLQKTYNGKIKMIYIDPPYNTGGDFVYKDNFADSIKNYREQTQQSAKSNPETNGRYHTDWLNMMYSRLYIAKNLLKNDGMIFVSIDDNEVDNLKKVLNEIFGENNLVSTFIWNCSTAGGIRPKFVSKTHEYVLAYAKDINSLHGFDAPLSPDAIKQYNKTDEKGIFREKDFIFKNSSSNINQKYFIECPDGEKVRPKKGYIYRFIRETFIKAQNEDMVVFKQTQNGPLEREDGTQANWNIYIKKYLGNGTGAASSILPKELISIYNVGTKTVQDLFFGKRVFENVKPIDLILYFMALLNRIGPDESQTLIS